MKKFSFVAGLACLATIGGVFAAWTFGEFNYVNPSDDVQINSISIDNQIVTNYKIVGTAALADFTYEIKQSMSGDGFYLNRKSSVATDTQYSDDVLVTLKITDDDTYSEIKSTTVKINVAVNFSAKDSAKDCLLDLYDKDEQCAVIDGANRNDYGVVSSTTKEKTVGFNLNHDLAGGRGFFNDLQYNIESAAEAEKFVLALQNTYIDIVVTLTEFKGKIPTPDPIVVDK